MKKTLLVLCLLSTTAAFAQYVGGASYSNQPQIYESPSHPAHASYAPMSQEQSVLAATSYSSAQGERRASDFPQPEGVSLGAAARELRKQHVQLKKSRVVWVNQQSVALLAAIRETDVSPTRDDAFFVGSSNVAVAKRSGKLYFTVNDVTYDDKDFPDMFFVDNIGSFYARVSVSK